MQNCGHHPKLKNTQHGLNLSRKNFNKFDCHVLLPDKNIEEAEDDDKEDTSDTCDSSHDKNEDSRAGSDNANSAAEEHSPTEEQEIRYWPTCFYIK